MGGCGRHHIASRQIDRDMVRIPLLDCLQALVQSRHQELQAILGQVLPLAGMAGRVDDDQADIRLIARQDVGHHGRQLLRVLQRGDEVQCQLQENCNIDQQLLHEYRCGPNHK